MVLDEHSLDDAARYPSPNVEVDSQTLWKFPFSCIDLPIGKQQIIVVTFAVSVRRERRLETG